MIDLHHSMPALSILVPVCNVETYLAQCLDSILAQSFDDFEIICIDDGSTDNSPAILDDYAHRDARVRVVHKKNSGYGHSMNVGLSMATGEFIGIVESDDFIAPHMYEVLIDAIRLLQVPYVRCLWFDYWSEENMHTSSSCLCTEQKDASKAAPLSCTAIFHEHAGIWAGIYNRAWLEKNDIRFLETPGASYQDSSFFFKVLAQCGEMGFVPHPLLYYRQSNPNASMKSRQKAFCAFDEIEEMERYCAARLPENEEVRNVLFHRAFALFHWTLYLVSRECKIPVLKRAKPVLLRLWENAPSPKRDQPLRELPLAQAMMHSPTLFLWRYYSGKIRERIFRRCS